MLLALGLVAVIVGVAIAIPRIQAAKRREAMVERRERAAAIARERERLEADQRPRRGRVRRGRAHPRSAVLAALESAITRDANTRIARRELPPPPVRRTRCTPNRELSGGAHARRAARRRRAAALPGDHLPG
jgi:hypothetical protein